MFPPEKMAGHNAAKSLSLPYPSGPELSPLPSPGKEGAGPLSPAPRQQAGSRLESDYIPGPTQLRRAGPHGPAQDEAVLVLRSMHRREMRMKLWDQTRFK